MALTDRAAAVSPYAQQLLDNQDLQAAARQAAGATRAAVQRARGQDARKAAQDRKLRRQVTSAVAAVGELVSVASKSAPQKKSAWPKRIALLAAVVVGGWLISNAGVRARVQGRLSRTSTDDEMSPATGDETTPLGKEA